MELYRASGEIVEFPEIRKEKYAKDFSWGFYCTEDYEQAKRWAKRNRTSQIVNIYHYKDNSGINILKFTEMTDEWLDFIAFCRAGNIHAYDIVEGPMADDTVWNYVNDFLRGDISREAFWDLDKFRHPAHQISFHTLKALDCIIFERSQKLDE